MKKLALVVLLLLALNFLGIAGGIGYLVGTGRLDKGKALEVAKLLFPPPAPPATQPVAGASAATQPALQFDELIMKASGKSAAEQIAFVRDTFDAMSAQMERQRAEILSLKRQVDLAQQQVARDRAALEVRETALTDREQRQIALDKDEGFQKSLDVYNTLAAKQVKDVFMNLEESVVVRYLQAMEPRRVGVILKEFKTPPEKGKAQSLLEQMRKNDASQEAANASSTPAGQPPTRQ